VGYNSIADSMGLSPFV